VKGLAKLSSSDLDDLKKIINLAITDEKARKALLSGKLPTGVKKPSDAAMMVLGSITAAEMSALVSLYQALLDAGAPPDYASKFIL
jgi:hypothetical protein